MGSVGYNSSSSLRSGLSRRLRLAYVIAYLLLSLIVLRLWYLQCLNGSYYRYRSENNRIRSLKTVASRGAIFDREGRLMVGSRPSFNIGILLEDTPDIKESTRLLAEIIPRPLEELTERLGSGKSRPFEPQIVALDVSRQELARVKANTFRLPGVIVDVVPMREYPFNFLASHTFGYTREISKSELEKHGKPYRRGDSIGKTGLEVGREEFLKGKNGVVRVEVDARGNRRKELGIERSIKGGDVHLTLDLDLQNAAEQALENRKGALGCARSPEWRCSGPCLWPLL